MFFCGVDEHRLLVEYFCLDAVNTLRVAAPVASGLVSAGTIGESCEAFGFAV